MVVCAAIRRVVGPFQVMGSLLSHRHVLAQFDLEGIHPEIVQILRPSDLTGPSTVDTILVRHPRHRMDSQEVEWRDQQTVDAELYYIRETRPKSGAVHLHPQ